MKQHHPARILLLIGFTLILIWMFFIISCNTVPDRMQISTNKSIRADYDTSFIALDKRFIMMLYQSAYVNGMIDGKLNKNNWATDSANLEKTLKAYYK